MQRLLSLFAQSPYYDDGYYYSTNNVDPAVGGAVFATFMLFILLFSVISYVIFAYLLSRIFNKAGVESWKAWVPVYNNWIMLELGGQQGFWAVLAFIPIVNIVAAVFMYIAMYHIGLSLGKEGVFVLLAIFIPIVWLIWLAFDSSKWKGAPATATMDSPSNSAPAYQPPTDGTVETPQQKQ